MSKWTLLKKSNGNTESPYEKMGPYTTEQVVDRIKNNEVGSTDLIWASGMNNWTALSEVPEFQKFFQTSEIKTVELKSTEVKSPDTHPKELKRTDLIRDENLEKTVLATGEDLKTMTRSVVVNPELTVTQLEVNPNSQITQASNSQISNSQASNSQASNSKKFIIPNAQPQSISSHDPIKNPNKVSETYLEKETQKKSPTVNEEVRHDSAASRSSKKRKKKKSIYYQAIVASLSLILISGFIYKYFKKKDAKMDLAKTQQIHARQTEVQMQASTLKKADVGKQIDLNRQPEVAKNTNANNPAVDIAKHTVSPVPAVPHSPAVSHSPAAPTLSAVENNNDDKGYEEVSPSPQKQEAIVKEEVHQRPTGNVRFVIPSVLKTNAKLVVLSGLKKGTPFTVRMSGRGGEIADLPGFEKKIQWSASGDGSDLIPLSLFKAPQGSYKLTVIEGDNINEKKVFIGEKDAKFNAKIKAIKKTISFYQQQEKKKLFVLAKQYSKHGDELLKASAKFSSNPKVLKKQLDEWKSNFYKLNSAEMKSLKSGNYQLAFVDEWKSLVDLHSKWIELVDSLEQHRQPASTGAIKILLTQTENFKKRTSKLTVW